MILIANHKKLESTVRLYHILHLGRPVLPGDTLDIRTTITRTRGRVGWADGTAHVGDALACQASISFAFVEEGQAP